MFRSDCYFAQRNADTGVMEWFFYSREGIQGPFPSKAIAHLVRERYVAFCRAGGFDGCRRLRIFNADVRPQALIRRPQADHGLAREKEFFR